MEEEDLDQMKTMMNKDRKMLGESSSRSWSAGGLRQELRRRRAKTKKKLGFRSWNIWVSKVNNGFFFC